MTAPDLVRDTTVNERMTWGNCPVCRAKHGEACNPDIGVPLGRDVNGMPPTEGMRR